MFAGRALKLERHVEQIVSYRHGHAPNCRYLPL